MTETPSNHDRIQAGKPEIQPEAELNRRKVVFYRMINALYVMGGLSILFFLFLFWQLQVWQVLAAAGFIVAEVCFIFVGLFLARKEKLDEAATWVVVGIITAFVGNELVWEGITPYVFVSGLTLVVLASSILLPRQWVTIFRFTVIFIALFALGSWLKPLPRFDTGDSAILSTGLPVVAILLFMAGLYPVARTVFNASIRTRLLVSFVLSVFIPTLATGAVSTIFGARTFQERVGEQLESVATLKEAEINSWIDTLHMSLGNLLSAQELTSFGTVIAERDNADTLLFDANKKVLLDELNRDLGKSQMFDELFLMDIDGTVILSTDFSQENKDFYVQPFYQEGLKGKYITSPFYSSSLRKYTIVVTQPILNEYGERLGVIGGRSSMDTLNTIMLERSGLGQTGETYMVGINFILLTQLRTGETSIYVRTPGTENAVNQRVNGTGVYENALGREVVGVYHWLPKLQVALVAEQDQSEALSSLGLIRTVNMGMALVFVLIAVGVALLITRSIATPITELAQTVSQIAEGNLELTVEVEREDEIGTLAKAFNSMAHQLRDLVAGLELRVEERTDMLRKRTAQLLVASEVARDITTTTNMEELLNESVSLIRDRFGYYHAGIFLVDERGDYAILKAATGQAGQAMLAKQHKLKVGEVGIVGAVTSSGRSRIALDVGEDAVHFRNPLLPETRSEMALPLRVGDRVIGALDVQSTEASAFSEDDLTILQTMADQLAIAIENARLIEEMNKTLQELERSYGSYTQEAWQSFVRTTKQELGFRFQQLDVKPVTDQNPEAQEALLQGKTVIISAGQTSQKSNQSALAVPIKLRNQVIGVLNLRYSGETVPAETVLLAEEAAGRLALVLENARLLQEAQRLALREQQINVISGQIRRSVNIETILQNTVREVGRVLGVERTYIQVGILPDSNPEVEATYATGSNGSEEPDNNEPK